MFGREAAKLLDYVECFPDGYRKGIKIAKACANVGIEGFPTWVINGQVRKLFIMIVIFSISIQVRKLQNGSPYEKSFLSFFFF